MENGNRSDFFVARGSLRMCLCALTGALGNCRCRGEGGLWPGVLKRQDGDGMGSGMNLGNAEKKQPLSRRLGISRW